MRFLTLATYLLPVLALGGLVSGNDNGGESLHRPFNDNVFDLNDNLSGNRNMNREHPVVEKSESQLTTDSSTSIVTEPPLLRSVLDETISDSIMNDNRTPATKLLDNYDSVPTRQFSDDTDENVPEETTKSIGKYDESTYLPLVMSRTSNTTDDQQKQTNLDTTLKTSNTVFEEKETQNRDSSVSPSSSQPQFSDESGYERGEINSNIESTVEPIITKSVSHLELQEKGKPVISTDDIPNYEKLIESQNSVPNQAVLSDSKLPETVFGNPAHAEAAQEKEGIGNNTSGDQISSTLNDSYGNYDTKPIEEMKKEESSNVSGENSGTETSENWLSVLQSMVPSQKERLDFNEKMLQSIQNTVSNSNVNHNVMTNAPAVPCSHTIPPSSSNLYPSAHWPPSSNPVPVSPTGIPIEVEMSEEYPDLGIESEYPNIEYTDDEERGLRRPNQFDDPLSGWGVQPIETHFNPVIHIEGEIMIQSQSQPMRPTRRCRRILMKPERICKRGKPVCHTLWNGYKPVCKPGKVICREHPSQKPRVKLVCKRFWERLRNQELIYPVQSYIPSDYEFIDDQVDSIHESQDDRSISETNDCNHKISEILPTALTLEGVPDVDIDVDDAVSDEEEEEEEDPGVSEEVFEAAILKAINEAPEILAPEPNEGLESKVVQTLRPEQLISTEKSPMEISKPSPSLVESKKPLSIDNRNTDANNKANELPVTQSEIPFNPIIGRETAPSNRGKITNNSGNGNVNHNVNTNVNSNTNVNLNGNNITSQSALPMIQVPVISPVASPVIPAELSKDNGNSNTNANVNMNLNVNQNHNTNVNDNVRLSVQPTVKPRLNKPTESPQADPTMPTFEYNTPSESTRNINGVNQDANINVNSNSNINQQQNSNNQIEIPHETKIETPIAKIIPQVVEPIVVQPSVEVTSEQPANNLQKNMNTNVNSNVNINNNNNVNSNVQEPIKPNIIDTKVISVDKDPIVLPNVVLPSINQGNQNANVNTNLNVNSNVNKNTNENMESMIPKVEEKVQILIPEPIQVAEPPVEVAAPIYEVPLLPALSSSMNINSNVNQNMNNNVNSNGVDNTIKSMKQQQELPREPINQSMPMTTMTKPTPKPVLVNDVSDSVDDGLTSSDQNVNENLNRNVNVNSNQNINHGMMNQAAQFLPEIIPVAVPQSALTPISANVPTLHGNSNSDANINHNINNNVNFNSNSNAALNALELSKHDVPALVHEPRPVAVLPGSAMQNVIPMAPVPSQVSQDRNVNSNSNFNFNSNVNNNANQMIGVPFERSDSPIIKPVESQPVAGPNHLGIPLFTPVQNELRQNVNGNANVNKNVNVNTNVNTNHNVNSNGNYRSREKQQAQETPEVAKEVIVVPAFTEPTAIQDPRLEMSGNNDVRREPEKKEILERTELNKNHNMNVNDNRNSNVNVNQNLNLNRNNNIENRGQSSLATPAPAAVLIQEPISPPSEVQAPISSQGTILGPQVLQNAETNANYAANVNVNHNLNSNSNFNQNHQVKGEEPILLPPLTPLAWIQQPVLQHEIAPSTGLNVNRNTDVNLNKNANANINQNINLNHNHNIVSREPSSIPKGHEYFNNNNYAPILQPDVREPVMIAAPTPLIEEKKAAIPKGMSNSQINANQNANINMNHNSNYNHNANSNGKATQNENNNDNVPLINPHQNILPPVIIPQSPNRGTGLWNLQKNSNINANYNSNMNFNSNVNANSNYNSNIGQSGLGTMPSGTGGTRESNQEAQSPLFIGNPVIDTPNFPNTKTGDRATPMQLGSNAQQNIDTNANYNSNLNYNSNYNANYNHNANYNAQVTQEQKIPKRKGWYELWYNNGDDKDGWTEIWNNKQFKRFLEQQLKDMKQQEDIQAQSQAQAFAVAR